MNKQHKISPPQVSAATVIEDVARIVSAITGVQLGERQRTMVETRLKKRIIDLGLRDEKEYAERFSAHPEAETGALISLLTTHHTYFFREFAHFEALEKKVIPACVAAARAQGRRTLRIWSAACSRGQEVYSLSMFLAAHLPRLAPDFKYEIVGTDVDPESVAIGRNGVYHRSEIKEVPLSLLGDHWARGTGDISEFVKAKGSIKAPCRFEAANLLSLDTFQHGGDFDIVFCRNVYIYFTPEQVRSITAQLLKRMSPHGHLFIGISESLNGLGLPVAYEGPSIYSKTGTKPATAKPDAAPIAAVVPISAARPAAAAAPLRVLCVDDSPSVIALLKRILTRESGFEVVATAQNGLEAAARLKENRVDVITLDIHMPEQTGLEYLKANFGPGHPPVVMITSVSRESSDLALQCLRSGASDFVEKPALANFAERGEEIRTKLVCAVQSRAAASGPALSLDNAFKTRPTIQDPGKCLRSIVASYSSWDKLGALFRECAGAQPPSIVFVEGAKEVLPEYARDLASRSGRQVEALPAADGLLKPGVVYVADFASSFEAVMRKEANRLVSILVYGGISAHGASALGRVRRPAHQLLVEDPGASPRPEQQRLAATATDVVPATSFAYMSTLHLSQGHGGR